MSNRVDYLSDKLVNLRGKLKNVEEVVPKESIVNGVSTPAVKPEAAAAVDATTSPAAVRASQAMERRREQTCQLHADYEQRLVRRMRQLEIQQQKLRQMMDDLTALQQQLDLRKETLEKLRIDENAVLTQVELGERFRSIDRERLAFFACDGEIEMILSGNNSSSSTAANETPRPVEESFKSMMKRGWALALTLGTVTGTAVIIAALIVYLGWR